MKAITILHPWAMLIASGEKTIETRPWSTSYRGPLAIHVSKRFPRQLRDLYRRDPRFRSYLANLHLGEIVAVCDLVDILPTPSLGSKGLERTCGDFTHGGFAWLLENVRVLGEPVPAKGSLGLWECNLDLLSMESELSGPQC